MEDIQQLKSELKHLYAVLNKKNIALDAMYWVWCDGGCEGGVNRYIPSELTEEIVAAAERNTRRMRKWLTNRIFREEWNKMSQAEKDAWMKQQISVDTKGS